MIRYRSFDPKIAVLMAHYGDGTFLEEAVGSVLAQSFRDFQLLLIDDASPGDCWLEKLRPFWKDERLRVYRSDCNVGPYRLFNVFFERISSPYFCIHDADDISEPGRLEEQVRFLEQDKAELIGCRFNYINSNGDKIGFGRMPFNVNLHDKLGRKFTILHPTAMFKRTILEVLGGYDGTRCYAADQDFFMRATLRFRVRNLRKVLFNYRVHENSMTQSKLIGFASPERVGYAREVQERKKRLKRYLLRDSAFLAPKNNKLFSLKSYQLEDKEW